jgi:GNAT superfamily N-acetyltransferase
MDQKDKKNESRNLSDYNVGLFEPDDAGGITDLFRAVYGDSYPVDIFYSPDRLVEANENGDYISLVARLDNGKVIAVEHLFRSSPNRKLYEGGAGVTLKEYRGLGIGGELISFMVEEAAAKLGIEALFGEAVCNHIHMQKMMARFECFDSAIEIALMPSEAYVAEKSAKGRVAALLQFKTYKKWPHTVYLPPIYRTQLEFIYEALDDKRDFRTSEMDLPIDNKCETYQEIFDFARVSRMAFKQVGGDFETSLETMEQGARKKRAMVFQVWLPLAAACVGRAADICRGKGYFFGGLLMRWFGADGLLMQKLECDPDFEEIHLHSDRAKTILDMVKNDWARTDR